MSERSKRVRKDPSEVPLRPVPDVVWHDLECGATAADLPLWEELAAEASEPILELGCGTGRVGLHLARKGHEVIGIDSNPALVAAFNERAAGEELNAQALVVDARKLNLRRLFGLVLAPLQFIQLVGDTTERLDLLQSMAGQLQKGGRAAFAIVEDNAWEVGRSSYSDSLPDTRELHTWVFSSRALGVKRAGRGIVIERIRETVTPQGEHLEEHHSDHLDSLDAARFEEEAKLAQLYPVARREIPPDPGHAPAVAVIVGKGR